MHGRTTTTLVIIVIVAIGLFLARDSLFPAGPPPPQAPTPPPLALKDPAPEAKAPATPAAPAPKSAPTSKSAPKAAPKSADSAALPPPDSPDSTPDPKAPPPAAVAIPEPESPRAALTASEAVTPESEAEKRQVVEEAKRFIAKLTETSAGPVAAERADHFVTKDQVISLLPEQSVKTTTKAELMVGSIRPDAPITLVREVEQVEITTPEKIIAGAAGNLDQPIRIVDDDAVREISVREVLKQFASNPAKSIAVLKSVKYFEVTTPATLASDSTIQSDTPLQIIKQPYHLEAATVAELLMMRAEVEPDTVFYVRTVRNSDAQGIWGIVHDGIIGNFARGMAIRRGEAINTFKVDIPPDADEVLADRSSSFLGKLIHTKTLESWVYNFKENRMGRNPDRVFPGQEIVIINFKPEELISIYRHFVVQRG